MDFPCGLCGHSWPMRTLTFFGHAHGEAPLQPAVLATVARHLVDDAVLVPVTRVHHVLLDAPPEEPLGDGDGGRERDGWGRGGGRERDGWGRGGGSERVSLYNCALFHFVLDSMLCLLSMQTFVRHQPLLNVVGNNEKTCSPLRNTSCEDRFCILFLI